MTSRKRHNWAVVFGLAWASPWGLSTAANGQTDVPQHVLTRTEHRSPNGQYVLQYDPQDKLGAGGARYRLNRGDEELWSAERPLSLWDILLTDDGQVCGYAYSEGVHGKGRYHAVVISRDGKYMVDDSVARGPSTSYPSAFQPTGAGIFHDTIHKRIVFRVRGDEGESWWVYDLNTGEAVTKFDCRSALQADEGCGYLFDAKQIPGAPLAVVHWASCIRMPPTTGFAVFDFNGNVVWSVQLPHDAYGPDWAELYAGRPQHWASLQPTGPPKRFGIHLAPDRKDIAYRVSQDKDGHWRVDPDDLDRGQGKE